MVRNYKEGVFSDRSMGGTNILNFGEKYCFEPGPWS